MRVFIADDAPPVRHRLIRLLSEQREVEVVGQTGDAFEALEAIRRLKPEVVVLAIHIHGGNGIDLLRTIRKEQPTTVIIMLTNSAYAQYRERCLQAGANFFFDKSIEFDQFTSALKQISQASEKRPKGYSSYAHSKSGY